MIDPYSYDSKCEALAEHFLQDEEGTDNATAVRHSRRVWDLSIAIQQAVEAWSADHPLEEPARSTR